MAFPAKANKTLVKKTEGPKIFVLNQRIVSKQQTVRCICEIPDDRKDANGDLRTGTAVLRYVRGESSLYADEQRPRADKDLKIESMKFVNGTLVVQPRERGILNFIERCSMNPASPNYDPKAIVQFKELNPAKDAKEQNALEDLQTEALHFIITQSKTKEGLENIVSYAEICGMNVDVDTEVLLRDMKRLAKQNPKMFLDGLNSSSMKAKYYIVKAIKLKWISVNEPGKSIMSQAGIAIYTCDEGVTNDEIVDEFVKYCDSKKGEKDYAALKDYVVKNS